MEKKHDNMPVADDKQYVSEYFALLKRNSPTFRRSKQNCE